MKLIGPHHSLQIIIEIVSARQYETHFLTPSHRGSTGTEKQEL